MHDNRLRAIEWLSVNGKAMDKSGVHIAVRGNEGMKVLIAFANVISIIEEVTTLSP